MPSPGSAAPSATSRSTCRRARAPRRRGRRPRTSRASASARGRRAGAARRMPRRRRVAARPTVRRSPKRPRRRRRSRRAAASAASPASASAAEVDEPVRRGDEERQVVEAVVVDAPDERAGHLPTVAKATTPSACARASGASGMSAAARTAKGQEAEPDLPEADLRVDGEQRRQIGRKRNDVPARGNAHLRYWSSCQLGVGRSSRSARPPFVSA